MHPVSTAYRLFFAREIIYSLTGQSMSAHEGGNGPVWPRASAAVELG